MPIERIHKLALRNFRCLPDGELGPFGEFCLIVGRNGAGKTSLFEAIELGLTGASARIPVGEDIEQAVSRNGSASVTIFSAPDITAGRFAAGRLEGGPQSQLRLLFDIDVTGRKASRLLPRLFGIHNVLYAEAIISFLQADEKKAFSEALVELAAGADAIKSWRKLEAASRAATGVRRRAEESLTRWSDEVQRLVSVATEVDALDNEHIRRRGVQLVESLPSMLWPRGEAPNVEPISAFLEEVSRTGARLSDTLATIDQLARSEAAADIRSWEAIAKANVAAEAAASDARSSRDRIREQLEQAERARGALRQAEHSTRERVSLLISKRDEYRLLCVRLSTFREWFAELQADRETGLLLAEQAMLRDALHRFAQIEAELGHLPSTERVAFVCAERERVTEELHQVQTKIESQLHLEREARRQLGDIEEAIRRTEHDWSITQEAVRELHAQTRRVIELFPGHDCPACGHPWESAPALVDAVGRHSQNLSNLLGKPSQELSRLLSDREGLQASLRTLSRDAELATGEQAELENQLGPADRELADTVSRVNHVLAIAASTGAMRELPAITLRSIGEQYPHLPFDMLRTEAQSARAKLDATQDQLDAVWAGKRKDEFLQRRSQIREEIAAARTTLQSIGYDLADNVAVSELASVTGTVSSELDEIETLVAQANGLLETQARELAALNEREHAVRSELAEAEKILGERIEIGAQVAHVMSLADRLAAFGVLHRRGPLDLASTRGHLTNALAEVEYLLKEGPRYVKHLQEESQVRRELVRAREAQLAAQRELAAAQALHERFSNLVAPGDAETHTLTALADTVNGVFRRLHWPFDFKAVAFAEVNGAPDLLVEPRFASTGFVPAHYRLSAGQRAALAISVFWALNLSRNTLPKIMLMDEPVQNIDELNALNFLDSLRWLIECGRRQIFLSTSSRRLAGLVRKKFSYLGAKYVEINLERRGGISDVVVNRPSPRHHRGSFAQGRTDLAPKTGSTS